MIWPLTLISVSYSLYVHVLSSTHWIGAPNLWPQMTLTDLNPNILHILQILFYFSLNFDQNRHFDQAFDLSQMSMDLDLIIIMCHTPRIMSSIDLHWIWANDQIKFKIIDLTSDLKIPWISIFKFVTYYLNQIKFFWAQKEQV